MLSQPSKKFLNQRWEHCILVSLSVSHHTLISTTDKNIFNGFTECWFVNKTKMLLNTIENCGVQRGYSMPIPRKWRWRRWNVCWWSRMMSISYEVTLSLQDHSCKIHLPNKTPFLMVGSCKTNQSFSIFHFSYRRQMKWKSPLLNIITKGLPPKNGKEFLPYFATGHGQPFFKR